LYRCPNEQNSEWGIETYIISVAAYAFKHCPNEQNSEWGIETIHPGPMAQFHAAVRTNRIPNGELKQAALSVASRAAFHCPNEQNSEWGIETCCDCLVVCHCYSRPNEQNSEWGIETSIPASQIVLPLGVRTNRIPNGELKLGLRARHRD